MTRKQKRGQAERLENWIGRNLGNIFYIAGSIVWGLIMLAIIKKHYGGE